MTVSIVVGGGGGSGAWRSGRNTPLQLSVGGLEGGIFRACCAFDTRVTIVVGAHSFASYDVFFSIGSFVVNATTSVLASSVSSSASRSAGVPLDVQF